MFTHGGLTLAGWSTAIRVCVLKLCASSLEICPLFAGEWAPVRTDHTSATTSGDHELACSRGAGTAQLRWLTPASWADRRFGRLAVNAGMPFRKLRVVNFRLFIVEMSVCVCVCYLGWCFSSGDCDVLLNWFPTLPLELLPYIDGIFVTVQNLGLY